MEKKTQTGASRIAELNDMSLGQLTKLCNALTEKPVRKLKCSKMQAALKVYKLEGGDEAYATPDIPKTTKPAKEKLMGIAQKKAAEKNPGAGKKVKPGKITKLKIHKFALLIPAMDSEQFEEFKADIEKNGQEMPILTFGGVIIDGRSRYEACLALGKEPILEVWNGKEEDLLSAIVSWNLKRRHLTAGQRAALGTELLPELEKEAQKGKGGDRKSDAAKSKSVGKPPVDQKAKDNRRSTAKAAKLTGSSGRSVSDLKKIKKESPEVFKEVKAGTKTITQAKKDSVDTSKVDVFAVAQKKLKSSCAKFIRDVDAFSAVAKAEKRAPKYRSDLRKAIASINQVLTSLEK